MRCQPPCSGSGYGLVRSQQCRFIGNICLTIESADALRASQAIRVVLAVAEETCVSPTKAQGRKSPINSQLHGKLPICGAGSSVRGEIGMKVDR